MLTIRLSRSVSQIRSSRNFSATASSLASILPVVIFDPSLRQASSSFRDYLQAPPAAISVITRKRYGRGTRSASSCCGDHFHAHAEALEELRQPRPGQRKARRIACSEVGQHVENGHIIGVVRVT